MKQIVSIIAFLALSWDPGLHAQKMGILAGTGAGSFRMDDLKYMQQQILMTYPVEGRIISSFPHYTTYSIDLIRNPLPYINLGVGYGLASTGGKSNYTDYSGGISTIITAILHRIGGFISYSLIDAEPFEVSVYGRIDANFTHLSIASVLYVPGYYQRTVDKYRSFSPAPSAGFEFYYHLQTVSFGLDAGYLVDIAGDLSERETGADFLDPQDRTRILNADWTGWRARLKVVFWIRK
jgi:hypothetical protein